MQYGKKNLGFKVQAMCQISQLVKIEYLSSHSQHTTGNVLQTTLVW